MKYDEIKDTVQPLLALYFNLATLCGYVMNLKSFFNLCVKENQF